MKAAVPVLIGALGAVTPKLAERLKQISGTRATISVSGSANLRKAKILHTILQLLALWVRTHMASREIIIRYTFQLLINANI